MLLKVYSDSPSEKQLKQISDCLKRGGIVVVPTDTVYSFACSIQSKAALEKMAQHKGLKMEKANFSIICSDLSHLSDFCKPINNSVFRLMKQSLPGAFTFILEANNNVPKIFNNNKKTIGIRVPNNQTVLEIVKNLGSPIAVSSVHDEDEIIEYTTDPELIHEKHGHWVDMVIDGGYGHNEASTIIDCTLEEPEIIRQGLGVIA